MNIKHKHGWVTGIATAVTVVTSGLGLTGVASASTAQPTATQAPEAQAASTYGPVTINCGYITCSAYLSRSATRAANEKLTVGEGIYHVVTMEICDPLWVIPPLGAACDAGAAVQGGWIAQEIGDAATKHGPRGACLKVTYTKPVGNLPPSITWWSTNNGEYCRD